MTDTDFFPAITENPFDDAPRLMYADWLEEQGYEAVTLEQVQEAWYHSGTLPPKPIVLSFDDGYRPQFTFALPTLKKHGWAGVLNLKAEGSDLYESNVKAMIAAGWELAAHTIHHLDLTELGPEELEEEVAGSRTPMSQIHIRMLLAQLSLGGVDLDMLTVQLAAALDGPVLLYLSSGELADADEVEQRIGQAWQDLVERVGRP